MKLSTLLHLNQVRWGQKFYRGFLGKTIGRKLAYILAKRQLRLLKAEKSLQLVNLNGVNFYNQSTHPDVLLSKEVFPGKFVMTISGYPYEDEKEENPYLLISDDGINFNNILDNNKPLVELNGGFHDHYSDGDIIESDGKIWLYYRYCDNSKNKEDQFLLRGIDKECNISNEIVLFKRPLNKLICPSVLKCEKNNQYLMFFVEFNNQSSKLKRFVAKDCLFSKELVEKTVNIINMPEGRMIWHIDVVRDDKTLIGLFDLSTAPGGVDAKLFFAESNDNGENWILGNEITLECNYNYVERVYRASIVKKANYWYLYIPIMTKNHCWFTYLLRKEKLIF